MTALTLYGNKTGTATLATAAGFFNVTGGTESSGGGITSAATGNGWLESDTRVSSGNAGAASGSIGTPGGQGYLWDVTTLEGQTFAAGTWTWKLPVQMSTTNTTFNTITCRLYKYNGGSYTQISTASLTSQAITTSKTSLTFTFSSLPAVSFATGDKLYLDIWFQLTAGWNTNTALVIYRSGGSSNGFAGDSELDTPGYSPTLSANHDISVRGRISASVYKDVSVRGLVSATSYKDVSVRGRIPPTTFKDVAVRGKVTTGTPQVGLAIANATAIFREDTFQLHFKADERQRFQATVLDYPGTARYSRGQQVIVVDPTLGRLFGGVIVDDKMDKSNVFPDVTIEHQIDTVGNEYFADKRTSNRQYTSPTYAGKIVFDAVSDALAAEGIIAAIAEQDTETQADWNAGTLTNTVATMNVGDGDLELSGSGGFVSASYSTATDWNTGTLTNTIVNTGGDLSLNGSTRNWNDNLLTNQTFYGSNGSQSASGGKMQLNLTGVSGGVENRSRFDFAVQLANFTAQIDVTVAPANTSNNVRGGLVYRTTGWQNANNTWAYSCTIVQKSTQTQVILERGSNTATGAGSSTVIGTYTYTNKLADNSVHTLQVVASGSTHTISVDGTQVLNITDGTYTAAGYIGVRFFKNGGPANVEYFDNFGVMAALSGTWQSAATSINSVSSISSSSIIWNQSLTTGGTVLVQTSIDGGSTFQNCSNGAFIPGLTPGTSGTGKTVIVKITLSNTITSTMPDVSSLQWNVIGGYTASGTWVSPALILTPIGRIGSSIVAWDANLPSTATTLGVDTSIDGGVTWTDVTANNGGPIPGLNGQPDPTVDGFDANTSANYTIAYGYNGGDAGWTWDTANSRVIATNGASAALLANAINIANIDLFCDMDYSDAGGLVWCFADPGDYYALVAADNQASIGTKNLMTLYKVSGNVSTTLATGAISFLRGTYHRIRATALDGVITCTFDGATIITYTDGSPLAAGQAGLYQAGGVTASYDDAYPFGPAIQLSTTPSTATTARYYQLWITPMGDSATGKTVQARCRLATTDATKTPQVLDLTLGVYSNNIGLGVLVPSADYRQQFISKMFDDLAKQSNYAWWIDQNKNLFFRSRQAIPAPWIVQSSTLTPNVDIEQDTNLVVEIQNDLYRNRQTLQGVIFTGSFTNDFQGDGQTTSFTLSNPVATGTMPAITLNGVTQKVGLKGTTGSQYYYAIGDPVIAQDSNQTVLTSSDRLVVSYTGTYIDILTVNNTTAQAALALLEGGTGIVEAVEDVTSRNMTVTAATTYANQLLTRYCLDGDTITFATYRNGLQVGQIVSVFIPEEGLFDVQMLIVAIDIQVLMTQPGSTVLYQYVVQASQLPYQGSWQKLLASSILLT